TIFQNRRPNNRTRRRIRSTCLETWADQRHSRGARCRSASGGGRVEIFRVGAVALTFEEFHCHERIEKICDAVRMQVKLLADLRACAPALTECAEEIECDRSQQDLGIPEAERSLQNCVRCWRSCLHTVVDVAKSARSHK